MDEELAVEHAANEQYEEHRATATDRLGRKLSSDGNTKPYSPPLVPEAKINVTDPDSREMRTQGQPNIQGYNAQAVMTEQQIIVAAEITTQSPDFAQLKPMVLPALRELQQARVSQRPGTGSRRCRLLAQQSDRAPARGRLPSALSAGLNGQRGRPPGWEGGMYDFMRRVLKSDLGRELYEKRRRSVEPVFGQIKHNRAMTRLAAVATLPT